mmetsp:Transcript_49215/g.86620  ORF Transcript_49215/g.86620 Transcript_49215/m.86620 type:complete len:104 (+) Transcript_49215:744-1055(+)
MTMPDRFQAVAIFFTEHVSICGCCAARIALFVTLTCVHLRSLTSDTYSYAKQRLLGEYSCQTDIRDLCCVDWSAHDADAQIFFRIAWLRPGSSAVIRFVIGSP